MLLLRPLPLEAKLGKPKLPTEASHKAPHKSAPNERPYEELLSGITMSRAANQLHKATKKL